MDTIRRAAVHNNAVWCDAVCRALGCETAWVDGLWTNRDPAPPYYSNAVATHPGAEVAQRRRIREMVRSPLVRPWSVKDAFFALDLAPEGFGILFEAEWIHLPAERDLVPRDELELPTVVWSAVSTPQELAAWEVAGGGEDRAADVLGSGLFQPALLADQAIRFLWARQGDDALGVAIANRSDDGSGPVVGISNLVLGEVTPEPLRLGAVRAVRDAFPGLPMVGYERGDDLLAMIALGFEAAGPLRVWIIDA
jgi:hypothetical protein